MTLINYDKKTGKIKLSITSCLDDRAIKILKRCGSDKGLKWDDLVAERESDENLDMDGQYITNFVSWVTELTDLGLIREHVTYKDGKIRDSIIKPTHVGKVLLDIIDKE